MRHRYELSIKIGERDHQYLCDPATPTEEAKYALTRFVEMIMAIEEEQKKKAEENQGEEKPNE